MPVKNTENGRAQADQRAAALGLSLSAAAFPESAIWLEGDYGRNRGSEICTMCNNRSKFVAFPGKRQAFWIERGRKSTVESENW